ncbi:MAG: hypothetical protein ACM3PF_12665, partial [Bacteroidota bacterium]
MNLPSSLALPRSSFFRSRVGILALALVAVLLGGAAWFALRPIAPPVLPTPATSPDAQAPVRALPRVAKVAKAPPAPAPAIVQLPIETYGPLTTGEAWRGIPNPAATAAAAAAAASPANPNAVP